MSARDLDTRIDWFRVIADLNRAGYSTRGFADSLGIARTTIEGWKAGSEPKHADGEKLLAWWAQVTGREVGAAPRQPRLPGIRPSPTANMRPVPTLEAFAMSRGIPNKARTVQTPGEPIATQEAAQAPAEHVLTVPDAGADDDARELEPQDVEIVEAAVSRKQVETSQEIADRTGRPYLDPQEGWVLPSAPNPNVAKIGGR
ncbi:hypothetical protein [Methyloversatilis discipulorum]|uniref:hypothetical protein n=1 Tax=Methyloversatilis discipulorum TaxID=1119528 RepID=UPI00035DA86F|nr:hypothetical protein [Methyloversatilis discipulorum]